MIFGKSEKRTPREAGDARIMSFGQNAGTLPLCHSESACTFDSDPVIM